MASKLKMEISALAADAIKAPITGAVITGTRPMGRGGITTIEVTKTGATNVIQALADAHSTLPASPQKVAVRKVLAEYGAIDGKTITPKKAWKNPADAA